MKQKTQELLQEKCPAALAKGPSPYVSSVYEYVDTMSYITTLESMGWYVAEAVQRRQKGSVNLDPWERHIVKMRHGDFKVGQVGDEQLELILENSHNGTCGFQIKFGIFRLVCSNGMVIPIEEKLQLRQIHKNFEPMELLEHIIRNVEVAQETLTVMDQMKQKILTPEEIRVFAASAMELRLDTLDVFNYENLDLVLEPQRPEDEGDNLWLVYNRVQEKLTKGGVNLTSKKGKSRKLRGVSGLTDFDFNAELGRLALAFLEN